MCVDTSNCSGTCGECMSDSVRRLTMANKQLTKMCDQYLAELQRARMPEELARSAREAIGLWDEDNSNGGHAVRALRDLLAWHESRTQR